MSHLTETQIRQYVGTASFKKGIEYAETGAVYNTRRRGEKLLARSAGFHRDSYRIEINLQADEPAGSRCSCPVGAEGRCKHVAAVLLTYCAAPDLFREIEDPRATLRDWGRPELMKLIVRMLDRKPELNAIVKRMNRERQAKGEQTAPSNKPK